MPQHDYNIANQTFPNFRADLNNALMAILSNNSGPTAPTTTVAGMFWLDTSTSNPVLKIRNGANTDWITLFSVEAGLQLLTVFGGVLQNFLTLHADPLSSMHAATKQYVDARVLRSGDTMTGLLNLRPGSMFQRDSGPEGGELVLERPASDTSLAGNVSIDLHGNLLRIFENGGSIRGAYIDLTQAAAGVGTNLLPAVRIASWGRWQGSSTPTIVGGHNFASVSRYASGRYTVSFANALPSANYCVVATIQATGDTLGAGGNDNIIRVHSQSTTAFSVNVLERINHAFEDADGVNFIVVN